MKKTIYTRFIKRPLDLFISLLALVILIPLFLIVALLVKIKLGSPVIFKQPRPGLNEKIFLMYKFRSMTNKKDEYGNLLPNNLRLTQLGKFLRSTSLDELPSIINIIKGNMSFVGPRPLLVEYLKFYSTEQRKRHTLRPGLTGLAQIHGRNKISWNEKFEYDCQYIDKVSFIMDIKILWRTIFKVIQREGINKNSMVTMEKFNGNN